MNREFFDYQFQPEVDMAQVEEALLLATMAAEGLHGRTRIRMEAAFKCDPVTRSAEVDATAEVGEAIARIFTALLTTTIGEPAFKVRRSPKEDCA